MRDDDRSILVEFAKRIAEIDLSDREVARIETYLDLLQLWNARLRLTGERDRSELLKRHVVDALACLPLLPRGAAFLDLGSGGGLPGAVVACVRPDLRTTLLDARQRPVSFLNQVIRELPLEQTRALAMRAEDAAGDPSVAGRIDVVTARALRMEVVFGLGRPLLAPGGRIVSMQSPATTQERAAETARRIGLRLIETRDYRLPDGDERRLVVVG